MDSNWIGKEHRKRVRGATSEGSNPTYAAVDLLEHKSLAADKRRERSDLWR